MAVRDLPVQEAIKIGLGLKPDRPPKQMAPLAEPWRPLRGAAAHLWWSYYRVLLQARRRSRKRAKSEHCFKQTAGRKTVIGKGEDRGSKDAGIEKMKSTAFIVARHDLQRCKFVENELPDAVALPDDALLIKVDRFAFTANNITYAVLGDELKYWQLFPAPEGFGCIPVWGFGDVIASRHPGVAEGERLFGYFPMATHLVIEAGNVSKRGLRDASAHRQSVAPVYNAYARGSAATPLRRPAGDYQALLRPLFMLSFLVDDFLTEMILWRARVILSSASARPRSVLPICCMRAQGSRGDRAYLGVQCRFRQVARLL